MAHKKLIAAAFSDENRTFMYGINHKKKLNKINNFLPWSVKKFATSIKINLLIISHDKKAINSLRVKAIINGL
jgi:hypothetical protein